MTVTKHVAETLVSTVDVAVIVAVEPTTASLATETTPASTITLALSLVQLTFPTASALCVAAKDSLLPGTIDVESLLSISETLVTETMISS